MRRILSLGRLIGISLVTLICSGWGRERARPNILFIMADDHTTQAIGAYGGRLAPPDPTPTIDALAENGMRFERVFCHNSICPPSRASILTGQYSQTNGVLDLGGRIPPERQFLPIELRKAGCQTAMIGKWHLKEEPVAWEFYDLQKDPREMENRYGDPSYETIIAGLKKEMRAVRRKWGETDEDYPAVQKILESHWDREGEEKDVRE